METEKWKLIEKQEDDSDYHVKVKFSHLIKQEVKQTKAYTLYSSIQYTCPTFSWSGIVPTLVIPYNDGMMGVTVNGNRFAPLNRYRRAAGVSLCQWKSKSNNKSFPSVELTNNNSYTMNLVFYNTNISLIRTQNKSMAKIPIGVLLKAISEMPYRHILNKFSLTPIQLQNTFLTDISGGLKALRWSDVKFYTGGDEEPSVEECVDKVYSALILFNKGQRRNSDSHSDTGYSTEWKQKRILDLLGRYSIKDKSKFEGTMSLSVRCIGTTLTGDIRLPIFSDDGRSTTEFVLETGTLIDQAKANLISKYNITNAFVERNGIAEHIQESSAFLFRAMGYKLKYNTILNEHTTLPAGTFIDEDTLNLLNESDLTDLIVETPNGTITLYRSDGTLDVDMFVTLINALSNYAFNSHSGDDTTPSSEFDISNRAMTSYEQRIIYEIENQYSNICSNIMFSNSIQEMLSNLGTLPSNALLDLFNYDKGNPDIKNNTNSTNLIAIHESSGKGTANLSKTPVQMATIQKGQFGRYETVYAPDSNNIGSVQFLSVLTKPDDVSGATLVPLEVVQNGNLTGNIVYVSALEERGKYIADWNDTLTDDIIQVYCDGDITTVKKEDVNYRYTSPFVGMSMTRTLLPFQEYSQPKRSQMGSKMNSQAVPLIHAERPLVGTGAETAIPNTYFTARDILTANEVNIVDGIKLKLFDVKWGEYATYTFLYGDTQVEFEAPITPATDHVTFMYFLNHKPNDEYELDDIVLYNQSCDMNEYDLWKREDQGTLNLFKDSSLPCYATGVNLRVGFMTYGSSTVDDAVVISSELIEKHLLTSIQVETYKYEKINREQEVGCLQLHEMVNEGDDVIWFTKPNSDKRHYIKAHQGGEVISIKQDTDTIKVVVASFHDAIVGDKVSGRYGNKSVIAKIVPKERMPYDPDTGLPLQIICSPLGVPSRMNVGQILEIALGACMLKLGKRAVVTPFYPNIKDEIKDLCNECNIEDKHLMLPDIGTLTERPITVGYMYFLKLIHMSNLKFNALGTPKSFNQFTGQPSKSATSRKGQRFEEMITWAFAACGGEKQLNYALTLSADSNGALQNYIKKISSTSTGKLFDDRVGDLKLYEDFNTSSIMTQVVFRTAGLDFITNQDDNTKFDVLPLNFKDISQEISISQLQNNTRVGHNGKETPNQWYKAKVHQPFISPFWVENFPLQILLGISTVKGLFPNKSTGESNYYIRKSEDGFNNKRDFIHKKNLTGNIENYLNGVDALVYIFQNTTIEECLTRLKGNVEPSTSTTILNQDGTSYTILNTPTDDGAEDNDDVEDFYPYLPDDENALTGSVSIDSLKSERLVRSVIGFCNLLKRYGLDLQDLIWEYIPIIPTRFRQDDIHASGRTPKNIKNSIITVLQCSTSADIYQAYKNFVGWGSEIKDPQATIRGIFFGNGSSKHGKIRDSVMSKSVAFSGRTVIVPMADPDISPYFVGLPWRAVLESIMDFISIHFMSDCKYDMFTLIQQAYNNNTEGLSGSANSLVMQKPDKDLVQSLLFTCVEYNHEKMYNILKKQKPSKEITYSLWVLLRNAVREIVEGNVTNDGFVEVIRGADDTSLGSSDMVQIDEVLDTDIIYAFRVHFGRQPTLHRKSIGSFFIKLVEGYCTHIHPVVCNGYNADFDGDTMWYATILAEAKAESCRTTSVLQGLISDRDGSFTLNLSQDMALGIFCASTYKDMEASSNYTLDDVLHYDSVEQLENDILYGNLHTYSPVLLTLEMNEEYLTYFSTAGRILLNSKLRDGFTVQPFTDPSNLLCDILKNTEGTDEHSPNISNLTSGWYNLKHDCIWTSAKIKSKKHGDTILISEVLLNAYRDFGALNSVNLTHSLYKLGVTISELYGVSMGLKDLDTPLNDDGKPLLINEVVKEPKEQVDFIDTLYSRGLVSKQSATNENSHIWSNLHDTIKGKITSNLSPNSNLFYMIYSGARGNEAQLMQSVGFVGTVSKTETTDISRPILHGYSNGLSNFDIMQLSYSARNGAIATQTFTEQSGYSTRQAVYMTSGLTIKSEDCGIGMNEKPTHIHIDRNSPLIDSILGKQIISTNKGNLKLDFDFVYNTIVIVDEKTLDLLEENKISLITYLDNGEKVTVKLPYLIDESERSNLLNYYSTTLPYTDETGKLTEDTLTWIEENNIHSASLVDSSSYHSINTINASFYPNSTSGRDDLPTFLSSRAYLPVQYDSTSCTYYDVLEDGTLKERSEESLIGTIVSPDSELYQCYSPLLYERNADEKTLTVKSLMLINERQIRSILIKDHTNSKSEWNKVIIRYTLSDMFKKLIEGRIACGLPHLINGNLISKDTIKAVEELQLREISVRTTLTCIEKGQSVCSKCYGSIPHTYDFEKVGESVGVRASQTVCERLTQGQLDVKNGSGKRNAFKSVTDYFTKLLHGSLVPKDRIMDLEHTASINGTVVITNSSPTSVTIIPDNPNEDEEHINTLSISRCAVKNGMYVRKGDVITTGITNLNQYMSTNIPWSALHTRLLLIKEYYNIFASINVHPKNCEILARAQTAECYAVNPLGENPTVDTSDECITCSGYYQLVVSEQRDVVIKSIGIAGVAFEHSYDMFSKLVRCENGTPVNCYLNNIFTGSSVGSTEAKSPTSSLMQQLDDPILTPNSVPTLTAGKRHLSLFEEVLTENTNHTPTLNSGVNNLFLDTQSNTTNEPVAKEDSTFNTPNLFTADPFSSDILSDDPFNTDTLTGETFTPNSTFSTGVASTLNFDTPQSDIPWATEDNNLSLTDDNEPIVLDNEPFIIDNEPIKPEDTPNKQSGNNTPSKLDKSSISGAKTLEF